MAEEAEDEIPGKTRRFPVLYDQIFTVESFIDLFLIVHMMWLISAAIRLLASVLACLLTEEIIHFIFHQTHS